MLEKIAFASFSLAVLASVGCSQNDRSRVQLALDNPDALGRWITEHDARAERGMQLAQPVPVADRDPLVALCTDAPLVAQAGLDMVEYVFKPMCYASGPQQGEFLSDCASQFAKAEKELRKSFEEDNPHDQLERVAEAMGIVRSVAFTLDRELNRRPEMAAIRERVSLTEAAELMSEWSTHLLVTCAQIKPIYDGPSVFSTVVSVATGLDLDRGRPHAFPRLVPAPIGCYERFSRCSGAGFRSVDFGGIMRRFSGISVDVARGGDGSTVVGVGVGIR